MLTFLAIFTFFFFIATLIYISTMVVFFITKVPFISTPKKVQEKMLELAKIGLKDIVYDLGCGSGRLLILADKRYQARALGFEISPWPYFLVRLNIFLKKSQAKVSFKNFFKADLSKADVIFCYLMPEVNQKLRPKLEKELRPGTRVISYAFSFHGWKPKMVSPKLGSNLASIYVYQKA